MRVNTLNLNNKQTLMQRLVAVSKPLLVSSASAAMVFMLAACSPSSPDKETTVPAEDASSTLTETATLRIAAAANLSDVLPAIIEGYKTDKGILNQDIEVTFASSGKLYAQIIAGAPYDVFLSANQDFPAKLVAEKLASNTANDSAASAKTHTPFTYAQGQLSLYSATKSLNGLNSATLMDALLSDATTKITIASPELAPYGASAQAYLQAQNVYDTLNAQKRLIQAENIGQAFQYAHTGTVDYGFVAQSQVTAIKATPEQFVILAPESYPAILQDGVVVSKVPLAIDFTDYLRSSAGQAYLATAGYLAVE